MMKMSVSIEQVRKQFLRHAVGQTENEHKLFKLYSSWVLNQLKEDPKKRLQEKLKKGNIRCRECVCQPVHHCGFVWSKRGKKRKTLICCVKHGPATLTVLYQCDRGRLCWGRKGKKTTLLCHNAHSFLKLTSQFVERFDYVFLIPYVWYEATQWSNSHSTL